MLLSLFTRAPLGINVIHDRNPLFVTLSDGSIRNGYNVHILNKSHVDKTFTLHVQGLDKAYLRVQGSSDVPADGLPVFADSVGDFRVFVTAPKQKISRIDITFTVSENGANVNESHQTLFVSEGK